ncbi:hypothetical protein [Priestia filamentosa]|uniref:hypothetical protein n=1 Tax=Priestia filamentosa TaxID=1402861 RepID=UPI0002F4D5EB|nr:hypothetical protein [Priestia filamentosa]
MLYFILLIILSALMTSFMIMKEVYIKTSTMAIVMALGIITEGALSNYFGSKFFTLGYGKVISIIIFSLWISFFISILTSLFHYKFIEKHYNDPLNRFGMGTWIAGTSISGILLAKHFTDLLFIAKILSLFNSGLWTMYIFVCIKTLLTAQRAQLLKKAHGILLLTTVSTQSIVLLLNTVWIDLPQIFNVCLVTIGILLYCISLFFIAKRYVSRSSTGRVATHWNNTNCILHGALSITGLACITSQAINPEMILFIWALACLMFFLVEGIEIYRMYERIKLYGIREGILTYDVSQWSRLFTFAMFYTFTSYVEPSSKLQAIVQHTTLLTGIWVILSLCLAELLMLFFSSIAHPKTSQIQRNEQSL